MEYPQDSWIKHFGFPGCTWNFRLCGGSLLGFGEELNVGAPDLALDPHGDEIQVGSNGVRIGHQGWAVSHDLLLECKKVRSHPKNPKIQQIQHLKKLAKQHRGHPFQRRPMPSPRCAPMTRRAWHARRSRISGGCWRLLHSKWGELE